jgi:hypothetical protein
VADERSKQAIIEAGLKCFAEHGFARTSMDEVATTAGVSKALIFHHFKNKKQFYEHLMQYSLSEIGKQFYDSSWQTERDFFARQRLATKHKLTVIKQHPAIYDFIRRAYGDKESSFVEKNVSYRDVSAFGKFFEGVDTSKFKPEFPYPKIIQMLQWFSKGFTDSLDLSMDNLEKVISELDEYMLIFKKALYKEEYIND